MRELIEGPLVGDIVGAFYEVYDYFGPGLAESIYTRSLEVELRLRGHEVARELYVEIRYKNHPVGWQRLDMVVDKRVIVENKATETVPKFAEQQLLSYLRATRFEVGLLLHFGSKPAFRRFIDTEKKNFALSNVSLPRLDVLSPQRIRTNDDTNDANTH